jgi:hypothetical protein
MPTSVTMLNIACHKPQWLRHTLVFAFVGLHGTAITSVITRVYAKMKNPNMMTITRNVLLGFNRWSLFATHLVQGNLLILFGLTIEGWKT